jgi:hypothetical protein
MTTHPFSRSTPNSASPNSASVPSSALAGLLRTPESINLNAFNALPGDDYIDSRIRKPLKDIRQLFVKQVILDNETTLSVETIKVPGFIGISDKISLVDSQGKTVSGHADIVKFLARDRLLICTYQWHKERHGVPLDLRQPLDATLFKEAFIKNEGHHAGALVPAKRLDQNRALMDSFASLNSPNDYHNGMYGKDGFTAVAQRLAFPSFVSPQQATGYINTVICWMALINPFIQFPLNFNGGDLTHVTDRATLREFLKNALLASLGDERAMAFFTQKINNCYCAEFMYVCLNTPLYPFNKATLTELLDGDVQKAEKVLAFQTKQNNREPNTLSQKNSNPEFKALNIAMPIVPPDLPPLDTLVARNGQAPDSKSLPFPPFKISHLIRRAFRVLLPRQNAVNDLKIAQAQAKLFKWMEPALIDQLGLTGFPATDPRMMAVSKFMENAQKVLAQRFDSYAAFDQAVDGLMVQADQLLGMDDRSYFVPPRIYVDLGQNDGDDNLPKGWGFRLETVAALISRSVIQDT